jgi:lipopolysaccharide assembly outer membrane protein LptD (OstA)
MNWKSRSVAIEVKKPLLKRSSTWWVGKSINSTCQLPLIISLGLTLTTNLGAARSAETGETDVEAAPDSVGIDRGRLLRLLNESRVERERQVAADANKNKDRVEYGARDSLLIDVKSRKLFLIGGGTINYDTRKLQADSVMLDQDKRTVYADGSPILWDGSDKIRGSKMIYSLDSRRGIVAEGDTEYEQGYYHGYRIKKVAPEVMNVEKGRFTTCDLDDPHFFFTSRQMKMYIGDKVVAKPVVFYVQEIPVFALPFMTRSIRKGRYSGLMVPRYSSDSQGRRSVENLSYYKVINEFSDFLGGLDYREERGLTLRSELNYALKYRLSGKFAGSYLKDSTTGSIRYEARGFHQQTIDPTTSLSLTGNFVSDKSYRTDVDSYDTYNRLNRELASTAAITKRFTGGTTRINLSRRQYLDDDRIVSTFPRLSFQMNRRQLFPAEEGGRAESRWEREETGRVTPKWYNNIYYSFSTNYNRNLTSQMVTVVEPDTTDVEPDTTEVRERTTVQNSNSNFGLNSSQKILGAYNFSTNFSYNQTWTENENTEVGNGWRGDYTVSSGLNTTLYGLFDTEIGPLRALRHVVNPSMSLSYRPDYYFRIDPLRFHVERQKKQGVGGGNSINFSLGNLFQAKTVKGDQEKKLDLANVRFGTSYRFNKEADQVSSLSSSFRTAFSRTLSFTVSTRHEYGRGVTGLLPVMVSLRKARPTYLDVRADIRLAGRGGGAEEDRSDTEPSRPPEFDYSSSNPHRAAGRGGADGPGEGPWRLNMTLSYSKSGAGLDPTFKIHPTLDFSLTRNWRFQVRSYYDLKNKDLIDKPVTIVRDLHCWEAHLAWDDFAGQPKYYFYVRIKDLPDIKVEQRGYSR